MKKNEVFAGFLKLYVVQGGGGVILPERGDK